MPSNDTQFIELCKGQIEAKLNRQAAQSWKQRDYEFLSELIFKETGTLLSLSTLKRLWRQNGDRTPHPGTLNALSKYLGYANWLDFRAQQCNTQTANSSAKDWVEEEIPLHSRPASAGLVASTLRTPSVLRISLIVIAAGVIVFLAFRFSKRTAGAEASYDGVRFSSRKVVTSGLPNTVVFDYDIAAVTSDSVFIQQSWNSARKARISKSNQHHTSIYYYPGFHKAKLIVEDKVVKQHTIHITTDGWLGLVRYSNADRIPIYLRPEDISHDGRLYASQEALSRYHVNWAEKNFLVSYYNSRDFGDLDGDNFVLETKIKNDLKEGGLTCQYANITIMCENGRTIVPLAAPGCVSNVSLKSPDGWVSGRTHDLSEFGCDLTSWNDLKLEVIEKRAQVTLNSKLVYDLSYENPAGRIIGLHYLFYGCGSVGQVRLIDEQGHTSYEAKFDG
jgi:hypothetical protein